MARAVQEGPVLSISDSADIVPGEEAGSLQGLTQKPAWGLMRQRQGSQELIWGRERGGRAVSPLPAARKAAEGLYLALLKLLCGESLPLSLSQ